MIRSVQSPALPPVSLQSTEQTQALQPQLKTATVEGLSSPVAERLPTLSMPRDEFSPSSPKLGTVIPAFHDHGPVVNNKPLDLSGAVADLGAGPVQDPSRSLANARDQLINLVPPAPERSQSLTHAKDLLGPGPAQDPSRSKVNLRDLIIDHGPVQDPSRTKLNPRDFVIDHGPVQHDPSRTKLNPRDFVIDHGPIQDPSRTKVNPRDLLVDLGPVHDSPAKLNPRDLLVDLRPVRDASDFHPKTHGIQPFSLEDAKKNDTPALRDAIQNLSTSLDGSST
ncbi:hypothetical protein [Hyalangium versicolor]|uniref:hypothetical protein n=1 Tax=Hyalangium versicolor TaxID=2861190 RepID=UPI001CCF7086|nr:hypothetical protein [Hyalangium versicolor]